MIGGSGDHKGQGSWSLSTLGATAHESGSSALKTKSP